MGVCRQKERDTVLFGLANEGVGRRVIQVRMSPNAQVGHGVHDVPVVALTWLVVCLLAKDGRAIAALFFKQRRKRRPEWMCWSCPDAVSSDPDKGLSSSTLEKASTLSVCYRPA